MRTLTSCERCGHADTRTTPVTNVCQVVLLRAALFVAALLPLCAAGQPLKPHSITKSRHAPDFKIPRTFSLDGVWSPDHYLESYPIRNVHEHLPTWKLYNLCKLVVAASEYTYKTARISVGCGPFLDMFALLEYNVPDLEVKQGADILFLVNYEVAIKRRFGPTLERLEASKGTATWYRSWRDSQGWQGVQFGWKCGDRSPVVTVMNFDGVTRHCTLGLEVLSNGSFHEVIDNLNGIAHECSLSKDYWWIRKTGKPSDPKTIEAGGIRRYYIEPRDIRQLYRDFGPHQKFRFTLHEPGGLGRQISSQTYSSSQSYDLWR